MKKKIFVLSAYPEKNMDFFYLVNFYNFGSANPRILIRIGLESWIRIRIETSAELQQCVLTLQGLN
jgi:hypothetical protein